MVLLAVIESYSTKNRKYLHKAPLYERHLQIFNQLKTPY